MAKLKTPITQGDEPLSGGQRRAEIAGILLQNGWDVLVQRLGLLEFLPGGWRRTLLVSSVLPDSDLDSDKPPPLPVPQAMRQTLEQLGPTFVKLGQVLSTRADLLPEDYILELKKLQQNVPPVPWAQMEPVLLEEWNTKQYLIASGDPSHVIRKAERVEDIFESFNPVPIAAGSLGQAYRARMRTGENSKEVIVKLQRPGILPVVDADIRILKDLVGLVERTRWGKTYNFMDMVNEFASVIRNELDFFQEASNTETIGANLRQFYKNNEVQTPQIYWEYSSLRMLTMEFIEGENIELFFTNRAENLLSGPSSEETELSALDRERKYLSKIITNSFLHQIFIDGFFHADPHPGNLLLVFDPKQGHMRVVLLDFGMVGRVDPRSRTILIDFLLAIIKFDSRRATDRIMEFGKAPADINRHQFAQDLDHILRSTLGRPLREVQVGKILQDILDMTMRYRIQLPGIFITLLRVLITTEGICRQLDRDYILIQAAEPFVVQAIKNQFLQTFTLRDMARVGLELSSLLTALPRQLDDFLVNLNSGRVQFINEHRNLEGLERALRVLGNRIAAGLLVCGLSVSSAISLVLPAGPKLFGIPLLSMGLFTLSTLLGMWLLNGINRRE
jgi:predicted unusual protein kinase regulating ubiquinone biosynthesis (AarF/ABC1/UbiB family)